MILRTLFFAFFVSFCALTASAKENTMDWGQAQWIGYTHDDRPQEWSERTLVRNQPPADINEWKPEAKDFEATRRRVHLSPLLRKSFTLSKSIEKAEAYVCGLGLYEFYVNGAKVGDRVLEPAQTSYNKRVLYTVYDVTSLLRNNENALGLMLGNGFYGQNMAFTSSLQYGAPRAILLLDIRYTDGTTATIVSDPSWRASAGPILFDNIYLGESYDARLEINDWCLHSYDDSAWNLVDTMSPPGGVLLEQSVEPMRKIRKVVPIAILPAEDGWIIDMGQNMTGWLHLTLNEAAGTVVKMQFSEHLMPDKQHIDPASTGIHVTGGVQTDYYICKGEAEEQWEPRFTYHGFRYAYIQGLDKRPELEQFMGWLVRSDVERIGTFACSDAMINKFYDVSLWTIEDNIQGILTDCPHRERCAWMGDAYVVAEAASFNFDMLRFWRKASADMSTVLGVSKAHFKDDFPYDKRAPSNISVGKRLCLQARPDWGAATVMLPWYTYLYYGDSSIVEQAWAMMTGWMGYVDEKVQVDGIIDGGYGDWCPPGGNPNMDTPPALTSTALYYQSLLAMQKMAAAIGKKTNADDYAAKAVKIKQAFNERFFNFTANSYGSQTGNAFALFSHLVPEGRAQAVADDLAKQVMANAHGHATTGIFGHRALYSVLNDYGHADVTRHLWGITDYPSLGYMTEVHGLTTWPETQAEWTFGKRYWRNSFNHPMQSGFAATFHESIGGIRPDEAHPGFKHFILKPTFLPGLEWANVTYKSPYGCIKSEWKRSNNVLVWQVQVPSGTTADVDLHYYTQYSVTLDGERVGRKFLLPSGNYEVILH